MVPSARPAVEPSVVPSAEAESSVMPTESDFRSSKKSVIMPNRVRLNNGMESIETWHLVIVSKGKLHTRIAKWS